ncbi:armadillo-type protein [Microdochium trichocladiopsis]|uniref:Armadillo-type protein n=1 Tax=Microdochium trichocladiopsis TaxID=1682393 RepID=A0A9P8Y5A1_9PEZI|nr:armadillo-type protein [Microdochium trichocladiopsis]KAH7027890.1 armadillo-type protein [Microdochium trichocladiopsis]
MAPSFEGNARLVRDESSQKHQSQHQRSKSTGVFKTFMHRKNESGVAAFSPADISDQSSRFPTAMAPPDHAGPGPLSEIEHNQADRAPRSPTKGSASRAASRSPTKFAFSSISKFAKKDNEAPQSPHKTKSATNLGGLLGRPKSLRNLHGFSSDEDISSRKDKENRTPPTSMPIQDYSRPPIYAQFSSGALEKENGQDAEVKHTASATKTPPSSFVQPRPSAKPRPQSYHAQPSPRQESQGSSGSHERGKPITSRMTMGIKAFTRRQTSKESSSSPTPEPETEFQLDPKDIERHLEAMLDRRNIPEHQRYKMRNLADTIKMEFIRQDWAETRGSANLTRPPSHGGESGTPESQSKDGSKSKRSRSRGFTLSRNTAKKGDAGSPTKKKSDGTIGRHFRSRSTDSIASERPSSAASNQTSGILAKIKPQQGPSDYVAYLRKVQRPELVEVGKLHKLRLLLRNETVAWAEDFIRQGGMQEIVGLLNRIMEVEWREEHEDALLHETLLCLKALCTTALALQYLQTIQGELFPALLHMLFDPEKKGPSEFTTRNIITSVLFTYIQSAPPADRPIRARTVLGHLRDPEPKEEERPHGFLLEMHRERPYRVWCKEAVSVTKEVFWIFLHHLNVVYLPREKEACANHPVANIDNATYMQIHFPQERPPVPAAPYVGGVEWDATNYLASHLELLNAILACTPGVQERNKLRGLLRISGWERCMGASMRLCKEKFYPGVHDGLRTWVAAAADDGWDVRDVRYGPPPEPKSPSKKLYGGNESPKKVKDIEPPPKIDLPKFDFGIDGPQTPRVGVSSTAENWLS